MGSNILFYRAEDGKLAIGHINDSGNLVQTQSSDATPKWTRVVAVAGHILFYRAEDGKLAIGHINNAGNLVQTQSSDATPNWTQLVAAA